MCCIYNIRDQLHPAKNNPNRVTKYTKCLQEVKTDVIDLSDGLKVVYTEKLKNQNKLVTKVFELNKGKL